MITYVISQLGRVLHESLALATPPPQVTVNQTHYIVSLNGTAHHIRVSLLIVLPGWQGYASSARCRCIGSNAGLAASTLPTQLS